MKDFIVPILTNCCGNDEVITPKSFAEHAPKEFKMVNYVKNKNINRCYIIFYDKPEKNKFLKNLKVVFNFHAGSTITKVFEYNSNLIAISPLGGPAAASLMEEISLFGINEFIAIGSAGCLNSKIKNKFVLVDKAIRDEGTSYHYIEPSTYIETNKQLNSEIETYLKINGFKYVKATTWTNDAYYRETKQKIEMAKTLGAVSVEMECASWCAVAKYRNFKFSQLLYFSDLIKQDAWSRIISQTDGYHNEKRDIIVVIVKNMIDNFNN